MRRLADSGPGNGGVVLPVHVGEIPGFPVFHHSPDLDGEHSGGMEEIHPETGFQERDGRRLDVAGSGDRNSDRHGTVDIDGCEKDGVGLQNQFFAGIEEEDVSKLVTLIIDII